MKNILPVSSTSLINPMHILNQPSSYIIKNPGKFIRDTIKSFGTNNGLLLAGAVAYYALLSIVPLLILSVIVLSHVVDQAELLETFRRYLEWLVPSQSKAIVSELSNFLENRAVVGWVLLVTMLFFSSLGFSVLNKAMSVIFRHRIETSKRHFLVSALLPFSAIFVLGFCLLLLTLASNLFQSIGDDSIRVFGRYFSLAGVSWALLYILGLASEVLILTLIYWIVPVGGLSFRHALIGGATAAFLWEITRRVLLWYFSNLSQADVVYGTLTSAIVVMLNLEIAATLLLFGAQVIAQYELISDRIQRGTLVP